MNPFRLRPHIPNWFLLAALSADNHEVWENDFNLASLPNEFELLGGAVFIIPYESRSDAPEVPDMKPSATRISFDCRTTVLLITVYNSKGFLQPNPENAYSVNSLTAKKGPDGSVAIQFGGCDGKIQNCLPITEGWNYTARLFRPRAEILGGMWKFPLAQPES